VEESAGGGGKDWNAVGVSGRLGTEPIVAGVEGRFKAPWESSVAAGGEPGAFVGTEGISGSESGGRGAEDVRDGWRDSSRVDFRAKSRPRRSDSSGISSMEACLGLEACSATDSSKAWTLGSSTSSSSCFGAGFVSFGSSPALNALTIRTAWNLANLILPAISGSRGPQMETSSRKVAAAWNVSAVCLAK
jgi:hypothetical protein